MVLLYYNFNILQIFIDGGFLRKLPNIFFLLLLLVLTIAYHVEVVASSDWAGFESNEPIPGFNRMLSPFKLPTHMEQDKRLELSPSVWKTDVLTTNTNPARFLLLPILFFTCMLLVKSNLLPTEIHLHINQLHPHR